MKCWDCRSYTSTKAQGVGCCSQKFDPGNHPDGRLINGSAHACNKWKRPITNKQGGMKWRKTSLLK